jgi:hypothetical protein
MGEDLPFSSRIVIVNMRSAMGRGGIAEFPLDSDLKIMNPSQGFRSQLGPRPSHDMVVPKHILNCMASDLDHEEEEEDSKPAPATEQKVKALKAEMSLGDRAAWWCLLQTGPLYCPDMSRFHHKSRMVSQTSSVHFLHDYIIL